MLWTTTTDGESGTKISAGLPNITGFLGFSASGDIDSRYLNIISSASSAFSGAWQSKATSTTGGSSVGSPGYAAVNFNANNGASTSGIYGNSTTVQPPAIKVYMWTKISNDIIENN